MKLGKGFWQRKFDQKDTPSKPTQAEPPAAPDSFADNEDKHEDTSADPKEALRLSQTMRVSRPAHPAADAASDIAPDTKQELNRSQTMRITPPPAAEAPAAGPASTAGPGTAQPAAADAEVVRIPCRTLLARLPENLRGDAWDAESIPGSMLTIDKTALLEQLETGKLVFPLAEFLADLAPGWVRDAPGAVVELDLAGVVAALPPEMLETRARDAEDMVEVARMRDFFTPTLPAEPPPATDDQAEPTLPEPTAGVTIEGDTVYLPCRLLLAMLPEPCRGEQWEPAGFPNVTIPVGKPQLLDGLKRGKITLVPSDYDGIIPSGWIRSGADAAVALDLAEIVATLPPELLETDARETEDMAEIAGMRDFFTPDAPIPAGTPPVTAPAPTPTTLTEVPQTAARTESRAPTAWNGIEPSLESAALGVDINTADIDELTGLQGVGEARARTIVEYREKNGAFGSIFELADVPGIGDSLFRRMTGLSLKSRSNRHLLLSDMLGLREDGQPLLAQVVEALTEKIGAAGCLLTNREGIPLAVHGVLAADAARCAALGAHLLFSTERFLRKLAGEDSDAIILPAVEPPLLLLSTHGVVVIAGLKTRALSRRKLTQFRRATAEVGWLLGRRAVVRAL